MNAVIDIGNTNLKCAVFDDELLIDKISISNSSEDYLPFIKEYEIEKTLIAGSGDIIGHNILKSKDLGEIVIFDRQMVKDITIQYETPDTLGQDRIVNCHAASYYFPKKNNLIIDLGTCMTLTMVDSKNNLIGGSISPGYYMRAKSLNDHTHALPMVDLEKNAQLIGINTEGSILSGVQQGILMEINSRIDAYRVEFPEINVILTGGDCGFFENLINYRIFADSNFTLKGLNLILNQR